MISARPQQGHYRLSTSSGDLSQLAAASELLQWLAAAHSVYQVKRRWSTTAPFSPNKPRDECANMTVQPNESSAGRSVVISLSHRRASSSIPPSKPNYPLGFSEAAAAPVKKPQYERSRRSLATGFVLYLFVPCGDHTINEESAVFVP